MKIGVVSWEIEDGLAREAAQSYQELGHETIDIWVEDKLPEGLDLIFAYGTYISVVPLANQLMELPEHCRPPLIFWHIEQLPNPILPKRFVRPVSRLRSRLERLAFRRNEQGLWQKRQRLKWLTNKAYRFRYCGDLLWMQESGILTLLAIGSPVNNAYLNALGIRTFRPTSPSYREGWGADLNLPRDVPVLWLGKTATHRRRRKLERVRRDLLARGIEMLVINGEENPYIYGEARTNLLNRTRIVLNLLRTPWDSHAQRFQLAALNCALVVSEPCAPHSGFLPGEHFVAAPVDRLAETIQYYLDHDQERQQIANRARDLIKQTPRIAIYAQLLKEVLREGKGSGNESAITQRQDAEEWTE